MKFFISSDIEGVAGITHRNETGYVDHEYSPFAKQMSLETAAACEAILENGTHEIIVRDAHGSARNMCFDVFPEDVRFIREWSGDPISMMDGIDDSFDACLFIGYHNAASAEGNPLAHTMNSSLFHRITINDKLASEFMINSYTAAYYNVPAIFLSGDKALGKSAKELIPGIKTVATIEGKGASSLSLHPQKAVKKIKETVAEILVEGFPEQIVLPSTFTCFFEFQYPHQCVKASYFPGAEKHNDTTLRFKADDWYEVLRFIKFA